MKCNLTKLTTTSLAVKRFMSLAVELFTSTAVKQFVQFHKLSGQAVHKHSGHPPVNPISVQAHMVRDSFVHCWIFVQPSVESLP